MSTIKFNIFLLITSCIFSVIYFYPFLKYPAFNFIDDGATLWVSKEIIHSSFDADFSKIFHLLTEINEGRLRPVYHLYSVFIFLFFENNPFWYWFFQVILLILTLFTMGTFLFQTTKNIYISIILPLSLLVFVPTADNFYRLGTAEPKQVVLWLLLLLFCLKCSKEIFSVKKHILMQLLLWLTLLTKETSILFIPFLLLFISWQVLTKEMNKKVAIIFFMTILFSGIIFYVVLPNQTGYSTNFDVNPMNMWKRFYSTLGGIPILYMVFMSTTIATAIRVFYLLTHKESFKSYHSSFMWQVLLIFQAVVLLILGILPWQWPLSRYFYQLYIICILIFGLELAEWIQLLPKVVKQSAKLQTSIFTSIFLSFIFPQFIGLYKDGSISFHLSDIKMKLLLIRLDLAEYWLVVLSVVCLFFLRIKFSKYYVLRELRQYVLLFIYILVCVIFLSLIWKETHIHSYLTTKLLILIIFCIEIFQWKKLISFLNRKIIIQSIVVTTLFVGLCRNILFQGVGSIQRVFNLSFFEPTINSMKNSFDTYQISYSLITYLLNEVPPETNIFIFENEYEILFEVGIYASNLGRRRITVVTHSDQLITETKDRIKVFSYAPDTAEAFLKSNTSKIFLTRPLWLSSLEKKYDFNNTQNRLLPPVFTYNSLPSSVYWVVVN